MLTNADFLRLRQQANSASEQIGDFLYRAEEAVLAAIERARCVYSRRVRALSPETCGIKSATEGEARHPFKRFAILAIFANGDVPSFTMDFVLACEQAQYNLVVVSNGNLSKSARASLLSHCRFLIQRDNTGRDFGAYKDGLMFCLSRFEIDGLILANDSVYFLLPGLLSVINNFRSSQNVVGVSEVFEHHYHVSSFLMFFGSAVLRDARFRAFWRDYIPISTRMWTIIKGEGELTRVLVDAGYRPEILYRAEALRNPLMALSCDGLRCALDLLPRPVRKGLSFSLSNRNELIDKIINEIAARNQMHAGGFMFMKFLAMPLFKRDIVYRELYSPVELNARLRELLFSGRSDILTDLYRRSPPKHFDALRRLCYRHGYL